MENKKIEIKDIPGFEGRFKVTSDGRILNSKTGLPVKPDLHKHGYLRLKLGVEKKQVTVHRIVALTFLGPSNLDVNHKDGNKQNNNIDNLEYLTRKENMKHAFENGLNLSYKISDDQVQNAKDRYLSGEKLNIIASDLAITRTALRIRLANFGIEFKKNKKAKDSKASKRKNLNSKIYKIHPTKYPEIEKLFFEDKVVQADIARTYNVSISTIKAIIRELRSKRSEPYIDHTRFDSHIMELYKTNKIIDICRILNISKQTVALALKRLGILKTKFSIRNSE